MPCFDFLLDGRPDQAADEAAGMIALRLDEAALERKLAAARSYPELSAELEAALARFGVEPFRCECLRSVTAPALNGSSSKLPYYETYGEGRVAAGHYQRVIRHREHILPLADVLRAHVAARAS
jgi:hypothetical protein